MNRLKHRQNRRDFIVQSATGAASVLFFAGCDRIESRWTGGHPSIYVTNDGSNGLRTIDSVRESIVSGHSKSLWESLLAIADGEANSVPLQPDSPIDGRPDSQIRTSNLDYHVVNAAGKRIVRNALASLISGDDSYTRVAMGQLRAVIDDWPDWIDQAHIHLGNPAGLRTGMLAFDIGLAFDWLHNSLSEDEQQYLIAGLDRKAIQPFLTSLAQDPWWMHDLNNWTTTICGGLGVCGTALLGHHPEAERLIEVADETMNIYLTQYGPNGEFNENPAYANATLRPVEYFMARRFTSGGSSSRIALHPFPETCYWVKYLTLPSGYIAPFGDAHTDAKPWTKYIAAIASATSDPVLQHFYLDNHGGSSGDPVELLWYDPILEGDIGKDLPLGRVFPGFGGCVTSRTSWIDSENVSTVYGKASREDNHEHHDAGTLCIDGYQERLIVDLGSPSGYPADFFEETRWQYYNAGIVGHNILMFDGEELKVPDWKRGDGPKEDLSAITGEFVGSDFDAENGGWWKMDLSRAYRDGEHVERIVIHLFPGYIAVLDRATLPEPSNISLRWHTIDDAEPGLNGNFVVQGDSCGLACMVASLTDSELQHRRQQHEYRAPFHQDRTATNLDQRRESYVESQLTSDRCTLLSVFALSKGVPQNEWSRSNNAISIGQITCAVDQDVLTLTDAASGKTISVPLT